MTKILCWARHTFYTSRPEEQITQEGIAAIRRAYVQMKIAGLMPCQIHASDAPRAVQTAHNFKTLFDADEKGPIDVVTHAAYQLSRFDTDEGRKLTMLETLQQTSDDVQTLMVVSHEPNAHLIANAMDYPIRGRFDCSNVLVVPFGITSWRELSIGKTGLGRHILAPIPDYKKITHIKADEKAPRIDHDALMKGLC